MDNRTNRAVVIIGGIGSGKTVWTQNLAITAAYRDKIRAIMQCDGLTHAKARAKLLDSFQSHADWVENLDLPILVVDTEDHPAYRAYTRITPRQIGSLNGTPGFYRCFAPDVEEIEKNLQLYARNMVVICEDASKYMEGNITTAQRTFILDRKQRNIDLFYDFHGYSFVPPKIYRLINSLYVLRTEDSPYSRKREITCFEQLEAAYKKVKASNEKYPRELIKLN